MAVEPKRLCGYRKKGGLYLVGDGPFAGCHRLPFPLRTCRACGAGVKQSRGWTWVDGPALLGPCPAGVCECRYPPSALLAALGRPCAVCQPECLGVCGLLWIGESFYRRPDDFLGEAAAQGISRRLGTIPRGFELGKTWVLMAHPKAIEETAVACRNGKLFENDHVPGIVTVFRPQRLELILAESEATPAKLRELAERGITPVLVPDDDPDHQGSAYDPDPELDPCPEQDLRGA